MRSDPCVRGRGCLSFVQYVSFYNIDSCSNTNPRWFHVYMVNLTYMRSRVADMCSATHTCVQGGFGCVRTRVSEVEVVCRSFSMSHSMILVRVSIRIRGVLIYGQFDVYAFEGG